jgi:hypothetical protein
MGLSKGISEEGDELCSSATAAQVILSDSPIKCFSSYFLRRRLNASGGSRLIPALCRYLSEDIAYEFRFF